MSKNIFQKIVFSILLITLCIFTAGCCKSDVYVSINRNGDATISNSMAFVDEAYNFVRDKVEERIDEIQNEENPDRTAELYSEDGYSGIKITTTVKNIAENDISDINSSDIFRTNLESERFIDVTKTFFATKYDLNFSPIYNSDNRSINLIMKFTLKIPVKAQYNNADDIDETTNEYTWEFSPSNIGTVELSYTTLNLLNIAITAVLAFTVLAILIVIPVICINRKSKETKEDETSTKKEIKKITVCPSCQEKISPDADICPVCGEKIEKEQEESSQNPIEESGTPDS